MQNKKAFSFIEVIITISIIVLLAVIAISANQGYKDNQSNSKILSDVQTINNALISLKQETKELPMPDGNKNYFKKDTSYAHEYLGDETFGAYGSITEDTIAKKYLDIVPLDPRTNSYYSYGKTIISNEFEIASVQLIDGEYQAKVTGNYTAETGPYNLIREYNGSNFVYDKSKNNLPYNPEELILTATASGITYREGDTITAGTSDLEIFFSDGSVSVLTAGTSITLTELSFPKENNLTTLVKLTLTSGTIWTKATHLNSDSEFEVYTTDSTAAVRGTIFGVTKTAIGTEVIVSEGVVEVYKNNTSEETLINETLIKDVGTKIEKGNKTTIEKRESATSPIIQTEISVTELASIQPTFTLNNSIRDTETEKNLITAISNESITPISETAPGETIPTVPVNVITGDDETESLYTCTFIVEGEEMCDDKITNPENGVTYNLFAYAPYNKIITSTGQIDSIFLKMYNIDDNISAVSYFKNRINFRYDSYPLTRIRQNIYESNYGVFVDNLGSNDDYIKYSNLNLDSNFIIEMNVQIPSFNGEKHYLIHSGYDTTSISNDDIYLYIKDGYLYLGITGGKTSSKIGLAGGFANIKLERIGNNLKAYHGNIDTPIITTTTGKINNILVGSFYSISDGNYQSQINDIIDYIKIYK